MVDFYKALTQLRRTKEIDTMSQELVIKASEPLTAEELASEMPLSQPDDGVSLIKLDIGAKFDCVLNNWKDVGGKSWMIYGTDLSGTTFKMWADGWFTSTLKANTDIWGRKIRIIRLPDKQYTAGVGKDYKIIDLVLLEQMRKPSGLPKA